MRYKKPRGQPEALGARRLVRHMEARGWMCDKLGGGPFTVGWPDYYCFHPQHGERWIETKAPGGKLSRSQTKRFSRWAAKGIKIFVMEDETTYNRLFQEGDNWRQYLR